MKLYIVRHGISVDKKDDPAKPLSDEGKRKIISLAEFLSGKVKVNTAWHSEKLRAIQTAALLKSHGLANNLEKRDDINPLDDIEPIVDGIEELGEDIMLVGHLPFVGNLVDYLLKGKEIIKFHAGGIACVEKNDRWHLLWMINIPYFFD